MNDNFVEPLINAGRAFYAMGWLLGTSGNFSRRVDKTTFFITKSGKDKGNLCTSDFLEIVDGRPSLEIKSSAETCIHTAIYKLFDDAQAIYHVHEPYAALCSRRDCKKGSTILKGWEMIKGLGIWDDIEIAIPILPNHSIVDHIAADIIRLFDSQKAHIPVVNIVGHGVYAWGNSPADAKRHLESASYLFKVDYLEKNMMA